MSDSSHITTEFDFVDKNIKAQLNPKFDLYKTCSKIDFNKNTSDNIVLNASNSKYLFFVDHLGTSKQNVSAMHTLETYKLEESTPYMHNFSPSLNVFVKNTKPYTCTSHYNTGNSKLNGNKLEDKPLPRFIKLTAGDIRNFRNTKIIKRPKSVKSVISFNTADKLNNYILQKPSEDDTVRNNSSFDNMSCDIDKKIKTEDNFLGFEKVDVDCFVCKNKLLYNDIIGQLSERQNKHRNEEIIAAISLVELQNYKYESLKSERSQMECDLPEIESGKKIKYQCDHCNYQVNKKRHLELHLRVHIKPFSCTICCKTFSNLKTLEQHMGKFHGDDKGIKLLKCCFCNYVTPSIKRLKYHNRVHQKEISYQCNKCSFITLTKASLERHSHIHDSPKLHECSECGYITTIEDEMNSHMNIHGGKRIFKCELCTFQTSHRGYFFAHRDFHSAYPSKKENPDSETKFKCDSCSFVTLMRSSLLKHVKSCHHQLSREMWELLDFCQSGLNEEFQCPHCDYFSCTFNKLKKHAVVKHCKK